MKVDVLIHIDSRIEVLKENIYILSVFLTDVPHQTDQYSNPNVQQNTNYECATSDINLIQKLRL